MKTNRLIIAIVLLLGMTSCGSYYRMTSRIDKDGSMLREVYAKGDSAFRAGDRSHNPFMFQLDADWKLTILDSLMKFNFWGEEEDMNVKVSREIPTVNGTYFTVSKEKEYMHPLAVPHEVLNKNFRWFYTYYTYTATYEELPDKGPIPLSDYMTKEEQIIWFRGDNAAYDGLNGIELNDKLNSLETKFGQWYTRSYYEISWNVIRHFASLEGDTAYVHRLDDLKDSVYKKFLAGKDDWSNADPDDICGFFDEICQTKYFSQLYQVNQKAIEKQSEEQVRDAELFYNVIQFELTMPGRLLSSNARTQQGDLAIWKVDGFKLFTGNYVLTAESRVINYWAFGATLFLILAALGVFLKIYRSKH